MRCLFSVDWSILKLANNVNCFHSQLPIWVTNKLSTILAPKMVKRLHKACLNYPKWKVGEKMASFNYHQCAQQQNIKSIEPGQTNRVSLRTCISRIRNLGFIRSRFRISFHANHDFSSFQKLRCFLFSNSDNSVQFSFLRLAASELSSRTVRTVKRAGRTRQLRWISDRTFAINGFIWESGFMFQTYGGDRSDD